MTKKQPNLEEVITTQHTGNGNPPPKKPPVTQDPETFRTLDDGTGDSSGDTGNGNPPPKG